MVPGYFLVLILLRLLLVSRKATNSGMKATTIKLDGPLVKRLQALKPPKETLTGFVREVLDAEVRRRTLRAAAEQYAEFLRDHPAEADEVSLWATAPLEHASPSLR